MDAPVDVASSAEPPKRNSLVRNTAFLVLAQLVGTPLSVAVNAVMARHLSRAEFAYLYLAGTFVGFALLFIEWGQSGLLPPLVSRNPTRAGTIFATGVAGRLALAVPIYGVLTAVRIALHYDQKFQIALTLVFIGGLLGSLVNASQDVIRGLERSDISAYTSVGGQLLAGMLTVPTLLFGGGLNAVVTAQAFGSVLILGVLWQARGRIGLSRLGFDPGTLRQLFAGGGSFLLLGLALALQPIVDGIFLSKLAPAETVAWYAAARKLIGVLLFPVVAVCGAIYPTLSRLYTEDRHEYAQTTIAALRTTAILVVPVALGCFFYPDIGIRIFGRESFRPAEDDLRVLSVFLLLVYFTMTLGIALFAAGLQRIWALVQVVCVVISAALDPLLVPWAQRRYGNGGIGLCIAAVVSEVAMLVAAIWLSPKGLFTGARFSQLSRPFIAGAGMAAVAELCSRLSPFISAPLAVIAYGACLYAVGGVDKEHLAELRRLVAGKFSRR